MKNYCWRAVPTRIVLLMVVFAAAFAGSQTSPVIVSVRVEKAALIYRVNGKIVEDSKKNSLITNLARIASLRGREASIIIIVDVRAPFAEVGKLETALDKVDLTYPRRLFVADFSSSTMNEIHWDQTSVPIPSN
jgi:hypothetical protein